MVTRLSPSHDLVREPCGSRERQATPCCEMSTFSLLVKTSQQVSATRSRTQKIELLGNYLTGLVLRELPLAVKFLSGELPQGRIGLGGVAVRTAFEASADSESPRADISLIEVDQTLNQISAVSGNGATAQRGKLFSELLRRVPHEERPFLCRLVLGELRQGALEGIMVEAVARLADVSADNVRRALMLTGTWRRSCGDCGERRQHTAAKFIPATLSTDPADARGHSGQRGNRVDSTGRSRLGAQTGRRPSAGSQGWQPGPDFYPAPERSDWYVAGNRRARRQPARGEVDPRWRSLGLASGRSSSRIPDHDATLWPHTRH